MAAAIDGKVNVVLALSASAKAPLAAVQPLNVYSQFTGAVS